VRLEQELASAGKQFLSYKDGERCANRPAHNPNPMAIEVECVKFRVVTGPTGEWLRHAALSPLAHQVAIRVQNADGGHL
jgi:hypothetical protein